jgi:hypothetical protein
MSKTRVATQPTPPPQSIEAQVLTAFERHYTPAEIADLWGFDQTTIRRLFVDEPGVLKEGKRTRRDGKRPYVSLRIPASVAQRVHERKAR